MIVGILGRAGSGKTTIASALAYRLSFAVVGLADPLKRAAREWFGFSDMQLYGPSEERNEGDPRWVRPDGSLLTPRHALQQLGSEFGRGCHPDVWVRYALRTAARLLSGDVSHYSPSDGVHACRAGDRRRCDGVVIHDVRFLNEVTAIREAGGKVIRLTRGRGLDGAAGQHASETEMANIPDSVVDAAIDNQYQTVGESSAAAVELVKGWMP